MTKKKSNANGKNAQLRTRPRSPAGKTRAASKALNHGQTGEQVVRAMKGSQPLEAPVVAEVDVKPEDGTHRFASSDRILVKDRASYLPYRSK